MSLVAIICTQCGVEAFKASGCVNRSRRNGMALYCSRSCAGLAHRRHKTKAQLVAEKAEYDRQYREAKRDVLKAKKAADYRRRVETDPTLRAKEKANRERRKDAHLEYCRTPEYRKWKSAYDRQHLARKQFGAFSEAALVLRDLEAEIFGRASRYEIYAANGTLNKKLNRRRDYDRQA